ncbi:MAG: hypothetical protein FJX76_27390 [Armatimonadetes bacterium]|nr:hypothetical protein [Armatimonadota bacterium]
MSRQSVDAVPVEPVIVPWPAPSERRAWHEGLPFVAGALLAAALAAPKSRLAAGVLAAAGLGCAAFFRDPERETPREPDSVFAASDGVVLSVQRVDEPWWIQGPADRIAVFLAVTDVHVNRFPTDGTLHAIKKIRGKYAPAFMYAENNTRDMLALETPRGPITVAQISGVLARRSVQWHGTGDTFLAGDRLGMIKFGSRTDVYLPAGRAEILVSKGDRVLGGMTRIARFLK